MNTREIISSILSGFLLIALQVVLVKNFVLFDVGFCYVYVAILIYLPMNWNAMSCMLAGLIVGFIIDSFYDTIGIHASVGVLIGFLKPQILKILTPMGGYDNISSYRQLSLRWNISFSFVILVIHHIYLFILEAAGFDLFFFTILKIILSVFFSLLAIQLYRTIFFTSYGRE